MIYLTVTENWFIYIGIILGSILLIGLILYLTCGFRFKREKKSTIEHVVVDEEFMNDLLNGLGQSSNIENVSVDNGRLKFRVKDLDLLNPDLLKKISTSGVFITGNNVKLLFKYDSNVILEELNRRGVK